MKSSHPANTRPAQKALLLGLMSIATAAATTAQAGPKLFTAEWYIKAFGNELTGGYDESAYYSKIAIPQGIQCNPNQPRCPFNSTPTIGSGPCDFSPLGGSFYAAAFCFPWTQCSQAGSPTMRPAKGQTALTIMGRGIPPFYRNYAFFTTSTKYALPATTSCAAISTDGMGGPGAVMLGNPITGTWGATTTGTTPAKAGFSFAPAPVNHKAGLRIGQGTRDPPGAHGKSVTTGSARSGAIGQLPAGIKTRFNFGYTYTYATLRNDEGRFGAGKGPGSALLYYSYGGPAATIAIKQGKARFGGTMRMLGALTSKSCIGRGSVTSGSCSFGKNDWRYDAVGATAYTTGGGTPSAPGALLSGYEATYLAYYYNSRLMQKTTISVEGERFPWTTGSVTVRATGRGYHKTVQYAQGYDNRNSAGTGTVQLVTPVLTRWLRPASKFETAGIGILRIELIPATSDSDGDAVVDALDNCSDVVNADQDDSDADDCGNYCDADYDDSGVVGFLDIFEFGPAFGTGDEEKCHVGPIPGCFVGLSDLGFLVNAFGSTPGPSGTTDGTMACPAGS